MIDKIKTLEEKSRLLNPDSDHRATLMNQVRGHTEEFLNKIKDAKAYTVPDENDPGIYGSPISEDPMGLDAALSLLKDKLDKPGINTTSGSFLGYIPGGGLHFSALGDFLAAVSNRYSGVYFANPGAVQMENMLLDWMADLIGYPKTSGGNLSSGGSIANLTAIITARDDFDFKARDFHRVVFYMTEQVHHCVDKAIIISGLREAVIRRVPMDERFRMRADVLADLIKSDIDEGLRPFMVIASAGTTDTGAVDPIETVADIAKTHKLWFHIDGAYGGFFILSEEGKKILTGFDRSDSIVLDPHKGLFLPYGTGTVLVKDQQKMFKAHHYLASYMRDSIHEEVSPADVSPELTKHFRGLRLWLPLKLAGLSSFRAALDEKIWLTRYFYEKIQKIDGFEVGPYPDLSVMIFRYRPNQGDINDFNKRLVRAIHEDGRVFLSSTTIHEEVYIRLAVLCFRTHLQSIDLTLSVLKETVSRLLTI